jgi:Zn-dependent protease with chaperone function
VTIAEHRARFYDGETAVAREVTVRLVAGIVEILDDERRPIARWPLSTVTARGSIGDDAAVTLSTSAAPEARLRLETREAARTILARLPKAAKVDRFQPKRIAGWTMVGLAVVGLAAFTVHQLPALVAPLLPFGAKRALGESVARSLFPDEQHCTEPAVAPLADLADRLAAAAGIEEPLELIVVDDPMVNAFATPGGVVVVTRGLIDDAGDADEVAGVLAHEIGHVRHDHPTQGLLRSIGISALLQFLTGGTDLESVASAGGTLAFLSYSRAAEEEADATAVEILTAAGLHADGLARFFGRLQREEEDSGIADLIPSWLSTHPPTEARLQATTRAATGAPALDDRAWAGLQTACKGDAEVGSEPEEDSGRSAKPGSDSVPD